MPPRTIGLFGYGQFGRFFAPYLSQLAPVRVYDPAHPSESAPLHEVAASDLLVFAVPLATLDALAREVATHTRPDALILDVTSVKLLPLDMLRSHFATQQILGTHPIFGPQSGKDGIAGLPFVICNESWSTEKYAAFKSFLADTLKLRVIEETADQHDRDMAYVMGLSHLVGRTLSSLAVPPLETATKSFGHLLELRDLLQYDSWELFETIQNGNPYAREIRQKFLAALHDIEAKLDTSTKPPQLSK